MRSELLAIGLALPALAFAEPEYHRLEMTVEIDAPADLVWSKVGGYCDIELWLGRECEITAGDGGIGTVRVLSGTIVEPMVAQTELSYGYTQPVVEGQYYTLYHGFMEARPLTESSSLMIYTLVWDVSQMSEEQAAADIERRRGIFTTALNRMKEIAESD